MSGQARALWSALGGRRVMAGLRRAADANANGVVAGFLRPIDTARIARELEIDKVATANGRKDLPPSDSDTLDAIEQKIVQPIESEWTWHGGELVNHLRAYASRLIGFSINAEFQKLQLKANDALASLRAAHVRAGAELGHLLQAYVDARREYDLFRERHRLQRPARNQAGRWTAFGLLIVLVALESVLNGFFFAKGSEFGLVGGVGTAIGISVCNVGFAFLIGLGPCRWITHRNIAIKAAGLLIAVGGVLALVALHTFAAHLRDATAAVGEELAMARAFETMQRAPWALAELASVYLFGLGILFGLLALWKGCRFDDPYPGYGSHARRLAQASEAYGEEHAALFDDLEEIKDDTIRALEEGITRIPLFPQQAAQIRAQRAAMFETFRAYEVAVETAANQLLTQYRDKNREHRKSPVPAHFSRRWKLPRSFLESPDVKKLTAEPEQEVGVSDTTKALHDLRQLSKEVLGEYEALMTKYPHATQA